MKITRKTKYIVEYKTGNRWYYNCQFTNLKKARKHCIYLNDTFGIKYRLTQMIITTFTKVI